MNRATPRKKQAGAPLPRLSAVPPQSTSSESGDAAEPWTNTRATARAVRAAQARNSSLRRRHVDPATCERDYSRAEVEFMKAMEAYKQRSGRMFPTWSEVLEVLASLGYRKMEEPRACEAAAV